METIMNLKAPINNTWRDFFKKYTKSEDVAKVSVECGIGYHTLHNIKICNGNIANEKNKKALDALAKLAIENAKKTIETAEVDIRQMEDSIMKIIDNN
ncbi:hypothetical protein [Chryseobacterium indologenes]|uniref:Uncharacterized protein n=1 Tax=Chryseobacterium indologenes TaxID=253 RepID=A0A0N0ZT83_CHRID|nr:hypothetical protein [Chryseobacterium indologenes]KPE50120.1 hypothetical protein AOB46_16915 [Chryseobacterium indologenes]